MRIRYFKKKRKSELVTDIIVVTIFLILLISFVWIVATADTKSPQEAYCIRQKHLVENYPAVWTDTLQDICGDIENIN